MHVIIGYLFTEKTNIYPYPSLQFFMHVNCFIYVMKFYFQLL